MKRTSIVVSALLCGVTLNTLVQPNIIIPQTVAAAEQPANNSNEHPNIPPVKDPSDNSSETVIEPSVNNPITVTIDFVDQNKEPLSTKTVTVTSSYYKFPDEWRDLYGEVQNHGTTMLNNINSKKNHFQVVVNSISHNDTIRFKDQDTNEQVGETKSFNVKSGKVYDQQDINELLPNGYEFVDSENQIQATTNEQEHVLFVKKIDQAPKIVHKIFQIISDDGDVVKTIHQDLAIGSQFTLDQSMVGDDYEVKFPLTFTVDAAEKMIPIIIHKKVVTNKIQLLDAADAKEPLKELTISGPLGSKIKFSKDDLKGLRLAGDNEYPRFVKNENPIKIIVQIENEIQYIDQQGKPVGNQLVVGKNGQLVKLQAPEGFELPKDKQNHVIIPNSSVQKINVTRIHNGSTDVSVSNSGSNSSANSTSESRPESTSTKQKIEFYQTIVSTHPSGGKVTLYDLNGKKGNRMISENSDWQVDKKAVINGETYFRVSTDEWVKAVDVFEMKYQSQIVRTKVTGLANLHNSKGQLASNRSLAPHSLWYSDKVAMINGQQHFRISTDEWISAGDVEI